MTEPVKIIIRPISSWPWPSSGTRRRSSFRVGWMDTDRLLRYELERLKIRLAVLEIDITEIDIRRDGWIRADARPLSPRVVVSFEHSKLGPLRYPCDQFHEWQDNVRAIALALEALRAVDRYGVTKRAEQYAGWKALPATASNTMTATKAAQVLAAFGGAGDVEASRNLILGSVADARRWARTAVKATHPDQGGKREHFEDVQTARRVLTAHHGASV